MKEIVFEKYKLINIFLFLISSGVFFYLSMSYNKWFNNADIYYIYNVFDGVYHPLMVGAKWLAGILGVLFFFPSKIFRKWFFYIAPAVLLLTFYLVQGISVYSTNILNPTRAKMAENGMTVLAVITVLFIAGHLIYDWKKKK